MHWHCLKGIWQTYFNLMHPEIVKVIPTLPATQRNYTIQRPLYTLLINIHVSDQSKQSSTRTVPSQYFDTIIIKHGLRQLLFCYIAVFRQTKEHNIVFWNSNHLRALTVAYQMPAADHTAATVLMSLPD